MELVQDVLADHHAPLRDVVRKLSKSIEPYSLRVNKTIFNDGKAYYAVVNTANDDLSKYGNDLKPQNIVQFRKAIELILETTDGMISRAYFRNLRGDMSVNEIDELISQLLTEKWLHAPTKHAFTLGPRAFLELTQFLQEAGIPNCPLCEYDVLVGLNCTNHSCAARLHTSCAEKRLAKGSAYKCAKCQEQIQLTELLN